MRIKKLVIVLAQIGVFVFIIGLWEILAYYNIIDVFLFSKPSAIYELFLVYLKNNQIMPHIAISVKETMYGLIIGSALGFVIASFLWFFPLINKILNPLLMVLNSLPKTALAPIFIIWVGTNMKGIIFVAISISLIITIMSLVNFFNNINYQQERMLRSFKAKRYQIYWYLVLPSNITNMYSTLKINIGMTWIGVIVGEFIVSKAGIGYLIMYGTQVFRLDLVMLGVILLAIVTIVMNLMMALIEFLIKRKEK